MTTVSTKGKMIHFLYKNLVRRQQKLNNNFPRVSLQNSDVVQYNIVTVFCIIDGY